MVFNMDEFGKKEKREIFISELFSSKEETSKEETQKEKKEITVYEFSFLKNQKQDKNFLKKGVDLSSLIAKGKVTDYLDVSKKFQGAVLREDTIEKIASLMIKKPLEDLILNTTPIQAKDLLLNANQKTIIKNKQLFPVLYVYSMSQYGFINILHVWEIVSFVANETRQGWERRTNQPRLSCCKKQFPDFDFTRQSDRTKNQYFEKKLIENCQFNPNYILCSPLVSSFLCNRDMLGPINLPNNLSFVPKKINTLDNVPEPEFIFDSNFHTSYTISTNFEINDDNRVQTLFCYNNRPNLNELFCTDFYDSILPNPESLTGFIKDSLVTCLTFQNCFDKFIIDIESDQKQHSLLYCSLYLFL